MRYLLDTVTLLLCFHRSDPRSASARLSIKKIEARGIRPEIAMQGIAEFWNGSTRPSTVRGGFGLDLRTAKNRLRYLERRFDVLFETRKSLDILREMLTSRSISGKSVHDARLVAVMLAEDVDVIVTLNVKDFVRYRDVISVLHPDDVA